MTDTNQTEALNEAELEQVTGGASLDDLKPRLTDVQGGRAIRAAGIRKVGSGIRAIKGVVTTSGGNNT